MLTLLYMKYSIFSWGTTSISNFVCSCVCSSVCTKLCVLVTIFLGQVPPLTLSASLLIYTKICVLLPSFMCQSQVLCVSPIFLCQSQVFCWTYCRCFNPLTLHINKFTSSYTYKILPIAKLSPKLQLQLQLGVGLSFSFS